MRFLKTPLSLVVLTGFLSVATGISRAAQAGQDVMELLPGALIEQGLAGGQVHAYRFTLASGQYLRLSVDQRGIDLVVKIIEPAGRQVAELDTRDSGVEPVMFIAKASGAYRLEVLAVQKEAPAGRYAVKIEELREAAPQDESQIALTAAATEAKGLLYQPALRRSDSTFSSEPERGSTAT